MDRTVWIGWEPREAAAFAVARKSITRHAMRPVRPGQISGVVLPILENMGIYRRPHSVRQTDDGGIVLWDEISDAPMATQFACSRFLVPWLANHFMDRGFANRWALFMDCDMLVRSDVNSLFDQCDSSKAVMVVKHNHQPADGSVKMDGQIQTRYGRKNWSSVCAFNVDHPANKALTVDLINSAPGRDLHAFCWLDDNDIGELEPGWNHLVGHSAPNPNPGIVHFTDGIPLMPGYEDCEFADEWQAELAMWASDGEG